MIGNTYNLYTGASKSLLLLEKYNITCSLDRYLTKEQKDRERKKFAIDLENSDESGDKSWAFEYVCFDKDWKNNVSQQEEGEIISKVGLKERIVLLIICPQKDFHSGGSLSVPGADENSKKIADMIENEKNLDCIDEIYVALDTHYRTHIAHAICWKHVEETCDFEEKGIVKWKFPHDEKDANKYLPCFTALGLYVPDIVKMYEQHTSHIEKKFKWEYYSHDTHSDKTVINFFLEEVQEVSSLIKGKIEETPELEIHRKQKYSYLPFKKVMTFKTDPTLESKESIKKIEYSDLHRKKKENQNLVKIEYEYHPKEFATILNSDLKTSTNKASKSDSENRPLFEVIKSDHPKAFDYEWADYYTSRLELKGNHNLTIWPEHCIVGSSGHSVVDTLNVALQKWARKTGKAIQYIEKGQNCKTELYSILEAEVEDPGNSNPIHNSNHNLTLTER